MYRLVIAPRAISQLKEISRFHQKALSNILDELREDPLFGKPLNRDLTGRRSVRIGVYRIIYKIREDKVVWIVSAGHRSKVYN